MYEKRLTFRLISYWEKLNNGTLPFAQSFNSTAVSDVWPSCMMVSIAPSTQPGHYAYRYEYVGPELVKAYGRNMTGEQVQSRQKDFPGGKILEKMDMLIKNPLPMTDEGQFVNDSSKIIKYRSCLLPLGSHAGSVTHIVAGVSYRAF
jgi:hypothetical protein